MKKQCYRCKEVKDENVFAKNTSYCISCHSNYMKEWREKNMEKAKRISRSWKKKNPKKVKEYNQKWHKDNKNRRGNYPSRMKQKQYTLKYFYGLTPDDVSKMLEKQNNRCAICETVITIKTLHIDHNHQTNKTRSLLCSNCNVGIGHFCENIKFLHSAIEYLKTHNHVS